MSRAGLLVALALAGTSTGAIAQTSDTDSLREELARARAEIDAQRAQLEQQEARLRALEARMAAGAAPPPVASPPPATATAQRPPIERVGEAPPDFDRPPEVAVLGDMGSVVTRAGQLTGELQFEYARADRNRAVFRGFEVLEAPVLFGVFDINESRQDVLTASATLRYGVTDRLEFGIRVPYVYRNDFAILAPIPGAGPDAATIDNSAKGNGIGDLEVSLRYQLTNARRGLPFLIANLQAVIPTGADPFGVPRDPVLGRALEAATGSGFYGISPSLTAILPSDPVVLFGTLGYTFNLDKNVNTTIPPVIVEYVDPGDAVSASAGIGISFNERTTVNLGYAHSWAFGTTTRARPLVPDNANPDVLTETTSRDLQIGRLLFGVTYRVSDRASVNWSVEVGATEDATDLRTVLRIPFVLLTGG